MGTTLAGSAPGKPLGDHRRDRLGDRVVRVPDERAPVLGVDRASRGGRRLDHDLASGGRLLGRGERRQPAVGEPPDSSQLAGRPPTEPDVGRVLHRQDADADARVVEARAVVIDGRLGPQAAHQRQRLVEPRGALLARDAERLLLASGRPRPDRTRAACARSRARRGWPTPSRAAPGCGPAAPAPTCRASTWSTDRPRPRARPTGPSVGPVARSDSHNESKRRASSVSTSAPNDAPSCAAPSVPSPKPILIFIVDLHRAFTRGTLRRRAARGGRSA